MTGNDDLTKFALLDYIPIGNFILRQNFEVLFWNTILEDWTGISRQTILHQNIGDIFPHMTHPKYVSRLLSIFTGGPPVVFSAQLHRYIIPAPLPNGKYRIQHTTVTPLPSANGREWYALFSIQDHTELTHRIRDYRTMRDHALAEAAERRSAEEALRQRLAVEEVLATISTRFVNVADEEVDNEIFEGLQAIGQIVESDYIYFDWFSLDLTQIEHSYAWAYDSRMIPKQRLALSEYQWTLRQFNQRQSISITHPHQLPPEATAEKIWLNHLQGQSWFAMPLFLGKTLAGVCGLTSKDTGKNWSDEDIRLLRMVGEATLNVLARRRWQNTLHQAKESAEAANQSKSTFLANMSHELRTPLNAILGFSQLMARDASLTSEHKRNLNTIRRSGEHLLTLINDILEMSKIEAGRVTLQEDNFNLHQLLADVKEMFRARAFEKGLTLKFELAFDVPKYIFLDQHKLRQILINLLGNAIKFTSEGYVSLRVYCDSAHQPDVSSKRQTIMFEVKDTGVGIAPKDMGMLFDPFVQTASGKKSQEGTGLGLSISRQFVQMMGSDIAVNSAIGQGATFSFSVNPKPIKMVDNDPGVQEVAVRRIIGLEPHQPAYRILIVEDDAVNRRLLFNMLSSLGFLVREAVNGVEGVRLWRQWQPHLVWMDMRMPEMDGYEATRQIKSTRYGQKTVVVALTASAFAEDRERIMNSGCNDFVSKPFSETEIFSALTRHLDVKFKYAESSALPVNETNNGTNNLPALLAACSADWVKQLKQAAIEANLNLIQKLTNQIRQDSPNLAQSLEELIFDFEFDKILTAISQIDMHP